MVGEVKRVAFGMLVARPVLVAHTLLVVPVVSGVVHPGPTPCEAGAEVAGEVPVSAKGTGACET